jgi:subtilisin family serine protease
MSRRALLRRGLCGAIACGLAVSGAGWAQDRPVEPRALEVAAGDHRPPKELGETIRLPSGAVIDPQTREATATGKRTPSERLAASLTFGPSPTKATEALWLVRSASFDRIAGLRHRLEAAPGIEFLTDAGDGTYVVRATEFAVQPVFLWPEAAWIGEYDWALKLAPPLSRAVEAVESGALVEGSATRVAIDGVVRFHGVEEPTLPRDAPVSKAELSLPLEVWLFDGEDEEKFLDRLATMLRSEPRDRGDGSIELGTVIVHREHISGGAIRGFHDVSRWLRITRFPVRHVPAVARDLSVERILTAPTLQGMQVSVRCVEQLQSRPLSRDQILGRPTGIWPVIGGLDGSGEIIGHADTGVDTGTNNPFERHPDLASTFHWIEGERGLPQLAASSLGRPETDDWSDLTGHGTHTAGLLVGSGAASGGRYRGVAPGARIVHHALATPTGLLRQDIDAMLQALQESYDAGARLHSDSWGRPEGGYPALSAALDAWLWNEGSTPRDMLVVVSAGNRGENGGGTIASPADAKNCLAVGSVDTDLPGLVPTFSSRGPTIDGRVKPDLVAPGTWLISTRPYFTPALVHSTMEENEGFRGWQFSPEGQPPAWQWVKHGGFQNTAGLTDSRIGDYGNGTIKILWSPMFAASAAEISFWARWEVLEREPYGFHILFGDERGWKRLGAIRMSDHNPAWPGWSQVTIQVPELVRLFFDDIRVGFMLSTDESGAADGIYIDEFRVSGWDETCHLTDLGLEQATPLENDHYALDSGTSMSAPLVAGLAARYRQFLRSEEGIEAPSAILLKAALINGSHRPEESKIPSHEMGFGVAGMEWIERSGRVLSEAVAPPVNAPPHRVEIEVLATDEPLRATLVWFDPPHHRLVNDLDLVLRSPSGSLHPLTADNTNTVEDILVEEPELGRWTMEVLSSRLENRDLPFALVASGNIRESVDEWPDQAQEQEAVSRGGQLQ